MSFIDTVKQYNRIGMPLAHVMLWHGGGNPAHKVVPYDSSDFYVMQKQLEVLQKSGVGGVIVTEKGLGNPFVHNNAYEMCKLCNAMDLDFCILLDPSVATADKTKTKEQNFSDFMHDKKTQFMLSSPIYLSEKYVLDFNTGIDFSKVTFPVNILREHSDFGWIDTPPEKMKQCKIPVVFRQFFNGGLQKNGTDWNTGVWNNGPTKYYPNIAGSFFYSFLRSMNTNSKYWAFPLNDYDEGTEFEPDLSMDTGIEIA